MSDPKVRGVRRLAERPVADQLLQRLPELEVHVVDAKPDASHEATRPPRA